MNGGLLHTWSLGDAKKTKPGEFVDSSKTLNIPLPLMRAKFVAPVMPLRRVARPRIFERVFMAVGAKLVLVRAPAGFGKTTLMLELKERYERDGALIAWLHLDDADNDVGRLLACLEHVLLDALADARPMPTTPSPGLTGLAERAAALIDHIDSARMPLVLFLDDFEVIKAPAVLGLISQLLDRLPPGIQMVMGTRNVPEIGLGRLRARGQVVEVEPAELRMSDEETQFYLNQCRRLDLEPAQIRRLHQSTEGWVAALSLAAMSLERRQDRESFIAGFAGSNAMVADYFADDVLSGQPEHLREFLVDTSILETLNASLCDAVTGRSDSAAVLETLQRAELFVVPLDAEHSEFRYHSLFSSFLRGHLARRSSVRAPELHRRAAAWYLGQGRPIPAIRHAVASQDWNYAGQVLSEHAPQLMKQGRLRPLSHALGALPPESLAQWPRLRIIHAWAKLFTHGPRGALGPIAALESASDDSPEFEAHRLALEPLRLGMLDRVDEANALAVERWPRQSPHSGFPHQMLAQALALTSVILGRHDEARRYADEARRSQSDEAPGFSAQISEYVEAAIDLFRGQLKQATARIKSAAGSDGANFVDSFNRNAMPGLLLAEVLYETNELAAAERLLGVYVSLVKDLGLPDQLIVAHTLQARMLAESGDHERALMLLADLEATGHRLELVRAVDSARLQRAWIALNREDVAASRAELQRIDSDYWARVEPLWLVANDQLTPTIARLRLQIRSGDAARAVDRARQLLEAAEAAGRGRRALKLHILYAEALHRSGQQKPALRQLGRALLTAEQGFIRSFLDEGPYVRAMMQEVIEAEASAVPPRLLAALGKPAARAAAADLSDPPTPKEIRVLELLAEGLGNNAIGERMFVSESTVRAHLRSINSKLQASNRVQALVIARRLGIIG